MTSSIRPGAIVTTVGPHGQPNYHTPRIGRGQVECLYVERICGADVPYAHVRFFDGKAGGWPTEQLRESR